VASSSPEVSVVMAVFNGGRYLASSVRSILDQHSVDLELVVVEDGSTDGSRDVLSGLARDDARLRVLWQDNQGLTRALIRGCLESRGVLIARQDADDTSVAGRLAAQQQILDTQAAVSLVSCWTHHFGPEDEPLGTWTGPVSPEEATRGLRARKLKDLRGIGAHGSAMFRREDYFRVGGYRPEFYYAQDLDLWLRLTEIGQLAVVQQSLYCWRQLPRSITGLSRASQMRTAELILEGARLRTMGAAESGVLRRASAIRPGAGPRPPTLAAEGPGLYYVGKRLFDRRDRRAIRYLSAAARARPWHLKSWVCLLLAHGFKPLDSRAPR
jgi:Glycosyl transferase family 2